MSATTAVVDAASQLREQIAPVTLARTHAIPVTGPLRSIIPDGLPRGSTVSVTATHHGGGARTLALTLVAQALRGRGWLAMVGFRDMGMVAAAEAGVPLERCVVVGPDGSRSAEVVAALIDGFDVVLLNSDIGLGRGDGRRLAARLRERRGLLVVVGGDLDGAGTALRLHVTPVRWVGIDRGYGHLQGRRVIVEATGRGNAARPRRTELWLPAPDDPYATLAEAQDDGTEQPDGPARDCSA